MSTHYYRNYDLKAIKVLLAEIGRYRIETAFTRASLYLPRKTTKFYLEDDRKNIWLMHGDEKSATRLMKLGGYNLPHKGWQLYEVKRSMA